MTLFDPKSIQVLGADSSGNSVILCTMYVDTIADLPAHNAFANNVLSMGCRAIVINDNSVHRLNSAGQWVQIVPGNSTYTRAEIDSMIARIDATASEDRAALSELTVENASILDVQSDSMKLVYRHFLGQNSETASYRMVTTDFKAVDNAQQCGMYLITIINWSSTPNASIYIAYYSGGTAGYNALTKIGGADAQIAIDENRYINYTGKGKIQIYALQ